MLERKHLLAECEKCPLYSRPYVPDAPVEGAEIIAVGEAPGETEAIKGVPFIGASGKLLANLIRMAGRNPALVSRHNIVACRPPDNRTPTDEEIACCAPRALSEISSQSCKTVVALGKTPSELLLPLSGKDKFTKLSDRRGRWFRWEEANIDWISTWHPAYVLRMQKEAPALRRDIAKAYEGPKTEALHVEPQVIDVQDYETLVKVLAKVPDGTRVAFDIETDQVNWYDRPDYSKDSIIGLGFAWKTHFGVAVHPDLLYDDDRTVPLLNSFVKRVQLGAHNGKFDTVFLRAGVDLQIPLAFEFDTMLAHYALDENEKHGLKGLAQERYGLPNYEADIIAQYLRSSNDYYSKIPYDKLALYMIWDVVTTLRLWEDFEKELKEEKNEAMGGSSTFEWPFMNVLMPAQAMLAEVELDGIYVDKPYLQAWTLRLEAEAELYANEFRAMVGKPNLNMNSPKQLSTLLYDELELEDPGRAESRNRNVVKSRSTGKGALIKLGNAHPCLEVLGRYRRAQKMVSGYARNILDYVSVDGRVHPSYKVIGTETGRLSAVDPAIQTIPRPDDRYGAVMRSAFVAPPGYVFVIVDYSQGELRAAAHLSGDEFLLKVYEDGRDLHSEVSLAMYGPGFTKAQRVLCKMFNFSYLYGGTEHSFAEGAGIPLDVAIRFVKDYNRVMPKLARWKEEMFQKAIKKGYVETIFGRRRHFPVISRDTTEEIRKACVNMPVQSAMSDLTIISGIRLQDQGYNVDITVHDSLVMRAREEDAEAVGKAAAEMLVSVGNEFMPRVKWDTDAEYGKRWCPTPAEHVLSYATSSKKREDNDELKRLVKWLFGEPVAVDYVMQALQESCTNARADLLVKAAKELEVL